MRRGLYLISLLWTLGLASAQADLILNFTDGGGQTVNFHAFTNGTTASTVSVPSTTSQSVALPNSEVSNAWRSGLIGLWHVADPLQGSFLRFDSTLSSDITVSVNGTDLATAYNEILLSDFIGLDTITIGVEPTTNVVYPAYTAGQSIAWSGQGTFQLPAGRTFANTFKEGTYHQTFDGVTVSLGIGSGAIAVPEPSSLLLGAGVLALVLVRRRTDRCRVSRPLRR